jgi:hypothetical protein
MGCRKCKAMGQPPPTPTPTPWLLKTRNTANTWMDWRTGT